MISRLWPLFVFVASAHAELVWVKPVQEFQCTPEQSSVEAKFAFKNAGKTPVTVKSIVTSCGCTTARLDKKTYAPGESGEVVANYSFRMQSGALRKLITVTTDDGAPPTELDIRVFRHEPLTVKPGLVYWRTGDAPEAKTVQLQAHDYPVHVKSVTSSNPKLTATLQTVKEGEQYAVLIRPGDTAQKESAEITVLTDFPRHRPRATLSTRGSSDPPGLAAGAGAGGLALLPALVCAAVQLNGGMRSRWRRERCAWRPRECGEPRRSGWMPGHERDSKPGTSRARCC